MFLNFTLERYVDDTIRGLKADLDYWSEEDPILFLYDFCSGNTPPNKEKNDWFEEIIDHLINNYLSLKRISDDEQYCRRRALEHTTRYMKSFTLVNTPITADYFLTKMYEEENVQMNLAFHTQHGTSWNFFRSAQRVSGKHLTEDELAERVIDTYTELRAEGGDRKEATRDTIEIVFYDLATPMP